MSEENVFDGKHGIYCRKCECWNWIDSKEDLIKEEESGQ